MAKRTVSQILSAFLMNSYVRGFSEGTIYRGKLKSVCLPVLNCYSCPGAVGSCPVGSLQSVAAGYIFNFSFYAAGIIGLTGIIFGRFLCGWVCPFGLIQDLLHRVPSPKYNLPGRLRYVKYIVLLLPVLILPALLSDPAGLGVPYFCKWLCPAGTLEAAIPLYFVMPSIRTSLGLLFSWRLLWLGLLVAFAIFFRRGFCRVLCPLGAFYSLFNRFSFFSMSVDLSKCIACDACQKSCYASIPVYNEPNHPECTRCLECVKNCPAGAIKWNAPSLGCKKKALASGHF
ncbi:MAG: 4Fe-4S binding protein [Bacillota bacterium]